MGLGYALANSVFSGAAPLPFEGATSEPDGIGLGSVVRHGGDRRELARLVFGLKNKGITGYRSRAGERLGCACLRFGRPLSRPHRLDKARGNRIRTRKDTAIADGRIPLSRAGRDDQPAGAPSNTWPRTAPGRPEQPLARLGRRIRAVTQPASPGCRKPRGTSPPMPPGGFCTGHNTVAGRRPRRRPCVSASEENEVMRKTNRPAAPS